MHGLLFYDYVSDYLERRSAVRSARMAHLEPYLQRGELVLDGAYANLAGGAVILLRSEASFVLMSVPVASTGSLVSPGADG